MVRNNELYVTEDEYGGRGVVCSSQSCMFPRTPSGLPNPELFIVYQRYIYGKRCCTVASICHDLMSSEAFVCAQRNIVCVQTIFVCAQTNTLDFGPRRQENAIEYQNAK